MRESTVALYEFMYGCSGTPERPEDSLFVCEPGNEVSINSLCDGINDCGGGNDETTTLCESQAHVSLTNTHTNLLSPSQTNAGCHITGDAPTLESALRQSLM